MSDENRIVYAAERVGLPAEATPQQFVEHAYKMAERLANVEKALAEASKMAEGNAKAQADVKRLQAEAVVRDAIHNQWIDKSEEKYFVEDYIANPVRTSERINDRKYRTILGKVVSLRESADVAIDVDAEVAAKAAELMAANEAFKGKPAAARLEVLKRDERLSKLHREKHTVGLNGGSN